MKSKKNLFAALLIVPLPLIILTCAILFGNFGLVDDAFITARYAKNLALYSEVSYNPGERVEGYTSFPFVAFPAVLQNVAGLDPAASLFLLSFFLALGGASFSGWAAYRLTNKSLLAAFLGSSGLALFLPWAAWGASGMESTTFATLWMLTVWVYWSPFRIHRLAGVFLAIATMTRPEGILLLPFLIITSLLFPPPERIKSVFFLVFTFLIIYGTYFVWRYNYFGYLLPNTFYAKVDRFSMSLIERGASYGGIFLLKLSPLLIPLLLFRKKFVDFRLRALALSLIVYLILGIVAVGGDHFAAYRFGAHLLPGLFLLYAVTASTIQRAWLRNGSLVLVLVSSALFVPDIRNYKKHIEDVGNWTVLGQFMKQRFPSDWSVATLAIGAIGYYSELKIVDMYGIVDSHIAHLPIKTGKGFAGHEKYDNAYVLSRRPDVILLDNQFHKKPGRLFLWRDAAPEMEKRPEFKKEYRFVPLLTPAGYVNLFIRRDQLHSAR